MTDAAGDGATGPRLVLAVDASTYVGTVAVLAGGAVLSERSTAMRGADEERLMPAVAAALGEAGVPPGEARGRVEMVVCGAGPGSFTSLRIAGAIAKGIAESAGAPLVAVPSLALLAAGQAPPLPGGRYLATLDAMRGERYAAVVGLGAGVTAYEYLGIVAEGDVDALARARGARVLAAGAPRAGHADAYAGPHARGAARLGPLLAAAGAVDLDAWEPDYGRKAEAQVKWELAHGRALDAGRPP
jgi:tRNA threonylcarbamoyladenosine biosynthesis protein TsaB